MNFESPMQAGRGAFTPTQLAYPWMQQNVSTLQQATAKPKNFMATADKMWKPPALKATTSPTQAAEKPSSPTGMKQAWGDPPAGGGLRGSPQLPAHTLNVPPQVNPPQPLNVPPPVAQQRLPTPAPVRKPVPTATAKPALTGTMSAPAAGGFDFGRFFSEQVPQFMSQNPGIAGALLSSNPELTTGITKYTGGLGLAALTNLLQNGGKDFAKFLPSSQSPPQS